MKRLFSILLLVAAVALPAFAAESWKTYTNERFGFRLDYPPNLQPGIEPTNGGGRKFADKNEEFVLTASGHFLVDSSLESRWKDELKEYGDLITYKKKAKDWFVVSGVKDGREFYYKFHIQRGNWAELHITYPHAKAKLYDPWVERIVKSWTPFLKGDYDRIEP